MMSKFSVYIPATGQRDAFVTHFVDSKTNYAYDISERVAITELPVGSAESVVEDAGWVAAEAFAARGFLNDDELLSSVDGVYPFEQDGVFLGWEVDIRTSDFDYLTFYQDYPNADLL